MLIGTPWEGRGGADKGLLASPPESVCGELTNKPINSAGDAYAAKNHFQNVSQIYEHAACSVKGGNLLQGRTPVTEGISYLPTTHTALQINICIVQRSTSKVQRSSILSR